MNIPAPSDALRTIPESFNNNAAKVFSIPSVMLSYTQINLIRKSNPDFRDLSEDWFGEMPKQVRHDKVGGD